MAYIWRSWSMVIWMIVASLWIPCLALPEKGIFKQKMNQGKNVLIQQKSLYANASISIEITGCQSNPPSAKLRFTWTLAPHDCLMDIQTAQTDSDVLSMQGYVPNNPRFYGNEVRECKDQIILKNHANEKMPTIIATAAPHPTVDDNNNASTTLATNNGSRSARAVKNEDTETNATQSAIANKPDNPDNSKTPSFVVTKTMNESVYLVIIKVLPDVKPDTKPGTNSSVKFDLEVILSTKNPTGYLSSAEFPLLPFYAVMCSIYSIYSLVWLILCACQWRDLLRIQFWIGGVIAFGMVEKAVFYSVYNYTNGTGGANQSLLIFAELISCMKRTVARMLVIIVSLGYGIVKPRLGPMLNRVLGVGGLYFVLGMIESMMRVVQTKGAATQKILFASLPLALVDAGICWWVFMSLVKTTRTLRLRRNQIKLTLYRHFTNTLIFSVLVSVIFMVWSIKMHQIGSCIKDWRDLWLDEAFWHVLFSCILLVIMVLWRPTQNNSRYAFSPLTDLDEDDEAGTALSDAFDGMKMRSVNNNTSTSRAASRAEDDLKWVEQNIPTSVGDAGLPSLLDSDEEIMTTKFEMSKME